MLRACAPSTNVARPSGRRLVRVVGYSVEGASHDSAYDGTVSVCTDPAHSAMQVLWSTGVVVEANSLENVRPGLYAAWILSVDGVDVDCLHACAPARVGVARERAELNGDLRT